MAESLTAHSSLSDRHGRAVLGQVPLVITTLQNVLPQYAAGAPKRAATSGFGHRIRHLLTSARGSSSDRGGATKSSHLLTFAVTVPVAACLGAAAGYLLDRERGRARRHRLADQGAALVRRQRRHAAARTRYERGRLRGVVMRRAGAGKPAPVDDVDVKHQVHQALRRQGIPLKDLSIEVSNRTAVLRGQAASREQIDKIREIVHEVPGVVDVLSFLHRPGEPAPNKVEALRLSHGAD